MSDVDSVGSGFADQIAQNLRSNGEYEKRAKKIGNTMSNLEDRYLAALANPNSKEGDLKALEIKYQRAMRAYEAFRTLMQNMHEMMMRGIQALTIR